MLDSQHADHIDQIRTYQLESSAASSLDEIRSNRFECSQECPQKSQYQTPSCKVVVSVCAIESALRSQIEIVYLRESNSSYDR